MSDKKYKVGLAIMRAQPFHIGHESIIRKMLAECETAIVQIGSVQESRTARNPFTYAERMVMIANAFPTEFANCTLRISGIEDIHNINLWAGFAAAKVWREFGAEVDAYYCGSGESDGARFAAIGLSIVHVDREVIKICASDIRERLCTGDDSIMRYIPPQNHELARAVMRQQKL